MIFKIAFSTTTKFEKKISNTAWIKYLVDDKKIKNNLNEFLASHKIEVGKQQIERFLKGKLTSIYVHPSDSSPNVLILKKIKLDEKFSKDYFRDYLASVIQNLKEEKISSLQIDIPEHSIFKKTFDKADYYHQSFVEGVLLGNYTYDEFKSKSEKPKPLQVKFISNKKAGFTKIINQTKHLMYSVYFTRDLVNEPANSLTPKELYQRTKKELTKVGVKVTAFNKRELMKRKMGALLAVSSGSDNEPYLIQLHYKPKVKPKKRIALVGKGVTYDSGGLSIKPTKGMLEMKADMAGAGTVIGIVMAAAKNKLPVEIFGIVPAVENMISGKSFKPSDIIKTASGKSIEVMDTDAEGRLVLADALEFACKKKPDEIIDFATLTGAIAVALGLIAAGLFTKNDELAEKLLTSGFNTYERLWRMPFWDDYKSLLDSDIADISNLGPRWGGAITAGKFLEFFVDEKIPWAHIDLAGPAIQHKSTSYTEKFHTGFGVRLIYDYLSKI